MNAIFPELPTKLGIYTLTQQLGSGEHSELYLATQSYVDRAVVIEVLRPDCSAEEMADFGETARLRAAVTLPHVSPVLESARTGNLHYLIQEEPSGKPLSGAEEKLSTDKAFALIQAVAELYCACSEQGVAAQALGLYSIYDDGGAFRFFSPVMAGEISDEQRAVQMEQLADVLEAVLSEQDVAMSNISIIIHWLRYGYGNAPLQWKPLASSLNTLRAQKMSTERANMSWGQRLRALIGSRRTVRLAVRSIAKYTAFCVLLLCIIVGVGMLGLLYEEQVQETKPAFSDNVVHCSQGENVWRVQAQPVSVEQYAEFLKAWNAMSREEKTRYCEGQPNEEIDRNRAPHNWQEQLNAAQAEKEWMGFKMSMHAPVRGVSYYDALLYARWAGGELPTVEMLRTARRYAGEPLVEEWTSLYQEEHLPYERAYVIYPAYGSKLIQESMPFKKNIKRSFRIFTHHQ